MNVRSFADLLIPLAVCVLIGGWILGIVAFFAIGTETCADVQIPLGGTLEVCQDTTAASVIMLTVIGFVSTVGALFLWGLRHLLHVLDEIESNTRTRGR